MNKILPGLQLEHNAAVYDISGIKEKKKKNSGSGRLSGQDKNELKSCRRDEVIPGARKFRFAERKDIGCVSLIGKCGRVSNLFLREYR